jgi:hypothetical protein
MKKALLISFLLLTAFCINAETHRIVPFSQISIQEILDFVQPGDTVILEEGIYEIDSTVKIMDKDSITIQGEGEVWVLCTDIYEDVISIVNCRGIQVYGVKARHKEWVPEYACNGSVVYIANSTDIEMRDCEFNGCGAFGVYMDYSERVDISYCYLHHNSYSAFYLSGCTDIALSYNRIMDNASFLSAYDTGFIEMFGNIVADNE